MDGKSAEKHNQNLCIYSFWLDKRMHIYLRIKTSAILFYKTSAHFFAYTFMYYYINRLACIFLPVKKNEENSDKCFRKQKTALRNFIIVNICVTGNMKRRTM